MPLSAAAVRRRGDQIRRRRNALAAGGAALAVAALTVPVLTLTGGGDVKGDRDRDLITGEGDTTSVAITEQDLITDDDTVYMEGAADWFATDTSEGDGRAPAQPCAQSGYEALGAESVLQRDFELRNLLPDAPVEVAKGSTLNETIAQFESADAALEAYDRVAEWILDCEDSIAGAEEVRVSPRARTAQVSTGDAVIYDMQWGPVAPELQDPYAELAYFNETGIVLVGDRLAVLTLTTVGQDYNFTEEEGGTPMDRMVPPAADRLAPGAAAPSPTADPDGPDAGDGGTDLLGDGTELVQEMASNDDGAPVVADPAGEGVTDLDFCGTSVDLDADAVERLAANASGPEYAEAREVVVLPSPEDADALAASIVEAARACATQDVPGTTSNEEVTTEITPREDQPLRTDVVTRTYEADGQPQLGTTTWVVAHEGPLVLVSSSSSEGSAEPAALEQSVEDHLSRLRATMEWVLGLSES